MAWRSKRIAPAIEQVAASNDELLPLARAAAAGDPTAAATLVDHVSESMLIVVRKVLGYRHTDLDDVAQEATIAFLSALPTFREQCRVVHFASRVALVTAVDTRRRLRSRRRWWVPICPDLEEIPDEGLESPITTMINSRQRELVRQLLDELPVVVAEALALHYLLDHTIEEIGAMTSVSRHTIWTRLRRGKEALRKKISSDLRLKEMLESEEAGRKTQAAK